MWEAIAQNRRRSAMLLSAMLLLLLATGLAAGAAIDPQSGPVAGVAVALGVFACLWLVARTGGSAMLLASAGAHRIEKADAPQLWNVVEEMTLAAGLPAMPAVHLVEDEAPNAFAVGSSPQTASVAVTSGLLRRLDRDELQGVLGHEMGHIRNLDTRFLTTAAVMVGSIALITDVFLRASRGGVRRTGRGDGRGGVVIVLGAIVIALLAPLAARLLYLACSRRRELLADASSARFTRYPEGLARALEKIAPTAAETESANSVTAPLYIVSPLDAGERVAGLFSTHPPTEMRVKILRAMAGAGFRDYETASRTVTGAGVLGARTLAEGSVPVRAAEPGPPAEPRQAAVARARQVGELLGRLGNYITIPCGCGASIRVPPDFRHDRIACPRCGTSHVVPRAQGNGAPAYKRQARGWEAFRCTCGHVLQLGPAFAAPHVTCPSCGAEISVDRTAATG